MSSLSYTSSEHDKHFSAMADGLAQRLLGPRAALVENDPYTGRGRVLDAGERRKMAPGSESYRHARLIDLARASLRGRVSNVDDLSVSDVASMVMGSTGGGAYHTTSSFPNLLLDAANKALLLGYNESSSSFRRWCRQGPSVPDFKTIHRVRLSESPDLEMIPEGSTFPEAELTDSREFYAVETRGKAFSFTRESLINDDLDALSRIPMRMGRAAERTINKVVYAILTGNPNMSDGNPLFDDSNHSNDITSGAAPAVAELNEMQTKLRLQNGLLDSTTTLGTTMAYLIIPSTLEGATKQLIRSTADPSSSNAGVANIWTGFEGLIIEPQLDGSSTKKYYGAANPMDVDTIEYTFLQGEEMPVMEEEYDFHRKGRKYTVHQTFGAKAIDWRGLVRNAGE